MEQTVTLCTKKHRRAVKKKKKRLKKVKGILKVLLLTVRKTCIIVVSLKGRSRDVENTKIEYRKYIIYEELIMPLTNRYVRST